MSDLVQIPWQTYYWLRPQTLDLLDQASDRLGERLYLYADDPRGHLSGWRSYSQQNTVYQAWLNGTGPVASNPDTGPRYHMRGAAFDLVRTDATAQAACRAVGLIRDISEGWHWNHPNWANMAVIKVNTAAIVAPQEDIVSEYRYVRTQGDPALFTDTDGFTVTENITSAKIGPRRAGRTQGEVTQSKGETDAAWVKRRASIISYWKQEAVANRALFGSFGGGGSTGSGPTAAEIAAATVALLLPLQITK